MQHRTKIDQRPWEYQIEAKCPLKISSILFTSQRWQWPAKRLHFHALCKANSFFYTSGPFRLGWRLCGFPSILCSAVMGTLWLCEYSVDKVWGMTFNQKVILQKGCRTWKSSPMLSTFLKEFMILLLKTRQSFSVFDLFNSPDSDTYYLHQLKCLLLKEKTFFPPRSKTLEFPLPCSTVIPWVCLREECALGSFQHLWDRAGRRRHSDFCSRMPHSHPLC